ncbi:hypothetical protein [Streptomyces sp. CRN 30]|uniref:hypothetical protein n=1 Tax=Streptomyces sp. CRN 30 TaxID=3075613 RepID=UPI002A7FE1DB|nr:hypothetical protein [Streptomyces sp. CRN 30]
MNDPDRARPETPPGHRGVQYAGRALCWSLAGGMTTAAVDIVLAPGFHAWPVLWPLPWYLTCVSAVAWAVLRAREKAAALRLAADEDLVQGQDWERAA